MSDNGIHHIIEKMDEMNIPRKTKIGAEYSVWGRFCFMVDQLAALRAERDRLREALTFLVQWVADNNFEGEFDVDLVLEDAREALKGGE